MGSNFNGRLDSCWGVGSFRRGLGDQFVTIVYTLRQLRLQTVMKFAYDSSIRSVLKLSLLEVAVSCLESVNITADIERLIRKFAAVL
jgi:hypothetical protein